MGLSWSHILIVVLLFVLLFGRNKISELMGDLAQGIKSFKKGIADDEAASEPKVIEHEKPRSAAKRTRAPRKKTG